MSGLVDRLYVSPTCTEIVIDGAVYSVEAVKELLINNLLRRHNIDGRIYTEEFLKGLIAYGTGLKSVRSSTSPSRRRSTSQAWTTPRRTA
jgi:hypothetical protein